jgi:hypothetical protein
MLGEFQQSALRIEIHASMNDLRSSLTQISQLKKWLWPQQLEPGMPTQLILGLQFQTWLGPSQSSGGCFNGKPITAHPHSGN